MPLRHARARPSPRPRIASASDCGRQRRSALPRTARRRLAASGAPARTAQTPAFGRGWRSIAAQSPAAKTNPWLVLRSVASTCTQPAASQARPAAARIAGPTTPVAQSAVSTSRKLPSDSASLPSAQPPALTPQASSTEASTNALRMARRA